MRRWLHWGRLTVAVVCLGATNDSPIQLEDATAAAGVNFVHANSPTSEKYLPETMGGGVALFDYDNDGRLDIFFTNGAALADPMPDQAAPDKTNPKFWNRLYHQNPDHSFTDVTERAGLTGNSEAGYSMGVAVADYDGDGYRDLLVTGYQRNVLYRNNGDGTFSDVTAKAHLAINGWGTSAGFLDFDNDGDLDLFVTRYVDWDFAHNLVCGDRVPGQRSYCHPNHFSATTSMLFRNNGNGTFTDVSAAAGLTGAKGKGLGVAFADVDDDGWLDIFVANDSMPGQLFRNRGNGTFENIALEAGVAFNEDGQVVAGMGVDFADYDNDGRPDLVITDLSEEKYLLFRNDGHRQFMDTASSSGLSVASLKYSGWGARFLDLDGDGWKDLFIAQGHVLDNIAKSKASLTYLQPPLVLRNLHGRFVRAPMPGLEKDAWAGRGLAVGDLDNDGKPDLVIANTGQPAYILHNSATANHWLTVQLVGPHGNRDGLGARVKVTTPSGLTQTFRVTAASSYLSSSDPRLHIGLGPETEASAIEVRWPGGLTQTLHHTPAGNITIRVPDKTNPK